MAKVNKSYNAIDIKELIQLYKDNFTQPQIIKIYKARGVNLTEWGLRKLREKHADLKHYINAGAPVLAKNIDHKEVERLLGLELNETQVAKIMNIHPSTFDEWKIQNKELYEVCEAAALKFNAEIIEGLRAKTKWRTYISSRIIDRIQDPNWLPKYDNSFKLLNEDTRYIVKVRETETTLEPDNSILTFLAKVRMPELFSTGVTDNGLNINEENPEVGGVSDKELRDMPIEKLQELAMQSARLMLKDKEQ